MPLSSIRFEQAVYGSFPFRDQGYAMLAQSPGCRPEWLAELRAACQRYGERPIGAAEVPALFSLRLASGPRMIVGVSPQGRDDRGRPGALGFHALFIAPRDFDKAGCDPFRFSTVLQSDWRAETRGLPVGLFHPIHQEDEPATDDRAGPIAAALARGRRVAIESAEPIEELARQVWRALPERVRERASVATWAFGNGNQFDLVALPRLAGVALDASYVDLERLTHELPTLHGSETPPAAPPLQGGEQDRDASASRLPPLKRGWWWGLPARLVPVLVAIIAFAVILAGLGLLALRRDRKEAGLAPSGVSETTAPATPSAPPPARSGYRDEPTDPEERRQVIEALTDLADRFEVAGDGDGDGQADPTSLMMSLARRLRYRGPFLTAEERERLGREPGHDLALDWDAQIRRFADDRPLPDDFARGPLRWQLDTLAWSFHLDADARRSTAEVPHALAEALAVDLPIRPNPLAARYPALAAYTAFLGRLPRR